MTLWSAAPPDPRSRLANKPTLLFSWWCTVFSAALILTRVFGRKIRSDSFYVEDKVMFLSLVPLFTRMGLITVVLLDGTNNVQTAGLDATQIQERELGSKLVLGARIFFAMYIWMGKLTVLEFLKRTFSQTWRQSYERILKAIRIFLFFTFVAVVIATLAECHPFSHYWQVVPDPGPQCRQAFPQLITMGTADIITDILLIAFPVPIVIRSHLPVVRKFFLCLLFGASVILIGITGARVPMVIEMHGRQQYRTVWASLEILMSTFVANTVILGSFIRGTGARRNKYRAQSFTDSIERAPTRRTIPLAAGSDEDLFRSIGCRVPQELMEEVEQHPLPPLTSPYDLEKGSEKEDSVTDRRDSRWDRALSPGAPSHLRRDDVGDTRELAAFFRETSPGGHAGPQARNGPPARMAELTLEDVGGLLDGEDASPRRRTRGAAPPVSAGRSSRALLADLGGILFDGAPSGVRAQSRRRVTRRGASQSRSRPNSRYEPDGIGSGPGEGAAESPGMELKDVGGLLGQDE